MKYRQIVEKIRTLASEFFCGDNFNKQVVIQFGGNFDGKDQAFVVPCLGEGLMNYREQEKLLGYVKAKLDAVLECRIHQTRNHDSCILIVK